MKISHSGPYNTVHTQDENGHRVPYDWSSADIPQGVLDYVAAHKLWTKAIKARYLADNPPETDEQKADRSLAHEIRTLEASVTPRHLRAAALGDQFAIDHIQTVEGAIAALGVRKA